MDFGTDEERAAAKRVALACRELNTAIFAAAHIGINVRVAELHENWDDHSNLIVHRIERRTVIIPPSDHDAL